MPSLLSPVRRRVLLLLAPLLLIGGACSRNDDPAQQGDSTTLPVATTEPVATTQVPLEAGTQLFVFNPEVGHCFDERRTVDGSARSLILLLDCDKPHMFEVFALVEVPEDEYPGEANLDALSKRECPKQWAEYVGQPYETSTLELGHWAPDRSNWNLTLQHTMACVLRATGDDRLEGSKRGSRE